MKKKTSVSKRKCFWKTLFYCQNEVKLLFKNTSASNSFKKDFFTKKKEKNQHQLKMTSEKDFCTYKKTLSENIDVPKIKKVWN